MRARAFSLRWLFPSALLLAAPLTSCKKPEYPACKKDKHCKQETGEKCVDGTCQNCTADTDCVAKGPNGENWVCHEFRCTDPSQIPGHRGGEGSPCTTRQDCEVGLACKAGICSKCSEDADCAPGTCNLDTGRCSPENQCKTDEDCPMDEVCDGGMCVFGGNLGDSSGPCGLDAVFFAFDSDVLTPKAQEKLQNAAKCMAEQNRLVYLEAHADNVGTEEYNIMLTERRGTSVKSYLGNLGVSGDNMQVIAKGSLEATGNTESERSKDRRVQFIWP